MRPRPKVTLQEAEIIALKALTFLAADEVRLGRFLDLTGMSAAELKARASEASTLSAVLDYLTRDESLLLVFAAEASLEPEKVGPALDALSSMAEGS